MLQKTGLLVAALFAMLAGLNRPSAAAAKKRRKRRKLVRATGTGTGTYGRHGS